MQRVAVRGVTGSGKSTLARELARRLDVTYVELDALHHDEGWQEADAETLRARVLAALDGRHGWVVDGNYGSKLGDLVVARADTVVWLDLPLRVTFPRVLRRTVTRAARRQELWNGNVETFRSAFLSRRSILLWSLRMHRRARGTTERRLATCAARVVRLRSAREVEAFLQESQATASTSGSSGASDRQKTPPSSER